MKKFSITLPTALLIIVLSASGQNHFDQSSPLDAIDEFILEQMDIFHVPGLSACIIVGDSVVWNNNYGFMNLEDSIPVHDSTLFNMFSIGKSLTAACVMQLNDEQLLALDENINNFLPFQVANPHNGADSISPRMLMTHTSTINDWNLHNFVVIGDPTISLANFLEGYLSPEGSYYSPSNFYNQVPGTNFYYDNYGIALTGYLVEPITGISFNQYAKDSLLTPLGMSKSAWFLDELPIENLAIGYTYTGGNFVPNLHLGHPAYPGTSLRSTALELSNFVIMMLNAGVFNGNNILSNEAVDSMLVVQNPNWGFSYGLTGLGLFERDDYGDRIVWGHNGGSTLGYAAHYYFCKEENSGIVIATNSEQYVDPIVEYLFDYALTITNIPEKPDCRKVDMRLYPNPSTGKTTVQFDLDLESEISLSIRNIHGQEIKFIPLGTMKTVNHIIDCDVCSPGVYFINVQIDSGAWTKKLIIN
jgi:CubicO group peptidase (beta-lactamase class C family)